MNNQGIRVIIADSDCELVAKQLTANAARTEINVVDKVSDGESAIESIRKYQPDVVLIDICLPVLDGLGVMEQMKRVRRMSGYIICRDYFCRFTAVDSVCI